MAAKRVIKNDFSAGGVVWDPDGKKVLLIQVENLQGRRVWTFPKGHPESGESQKETALREVTEETGWACEIIKPLLRVQYFYTHKEVTFHKFVQWYLMKPVEKVGDFQASEVLDSKWIDLKEAEDLISYTTDKELLKAVSKSAT